MNLQQLIQNFNFKGIKHYRDVNIESLTNVSTDKTINGLYFCLRGRVDGHEFASEAVNNGAVCLVVEKYLDLPVTQILVEDSRRAMSILSAKFYEFEKSKIRFIGITGTNGKTTTAFITRHILQSLGKRVGMIGTEGVYINDLHLPTTMTTPDPIKLHEIIHQMDNNNIEYVVMEVSAHALALHKIDSIIYEVAGIGNITQDHLDYFNTMDNYARAKAELFTYKHCNKAIINIDDKYTRAIYKACDVPKTSLSVKTKADLNTSYTNFSTIGTKAIIEEGDMQYSLTSSLLGKYNLANTLMAIAFCQSLGFELSEILPTLSTEIVVPGRFNIIKTDKCSVVIDYAHTPDGIKKVLTELKALKQGKVIAVFGCGGNRDTTKRALMGEVATHLADYTVITSDNPRNEVPTQIIADIEKGAKNRYITIENRAHAIEYALKLADKNDIVAVLGKGNEPYQEVMGIKHPYSDYEVVNKVANTSMHQV